ncbi:uncharacterized protein [Muntiacus reevesi]|uniref:uncharacterized protein n=1 Tax=Muntiacus reevesi TaxID=9886 RepID=UPI0033079F37
MPFPRPCCWEPRRVLPGPRAVALSASLGPSVAPSLDSISVTRPINATHRRQPWAVPLLPHGGWSQHPAGLRAAVLLLASAPDLPPDAASAPSTPPPPPAPPGARVSVTFSPAGGLLSRPSRGQAPRLPGRPGTTLRRLPLLLVIQLQAAAAPPLKWPPSEHLLVLLAPRPAVGSACGQAVLGPSVCPFIRPQPLPSSLAWVAARNTDILCIPSC